MGRVSSLPAVSPLARVETAVVSQGRRLDTQTPRTSVLTNDFTRVGLNVVRLLKAEGAATETALRLLDVAVDFRNAIVHGNETQVAEAAVTGQIEATLTSYRRYRGVITGLASTKDHVAANEARHQPSDSATLVKPTRKAEAEPEYGEEVSFPLGLEEVHGTVHEVYGPGHRHVVIMLTPEISGVVDEPTTVTVPLDDVKRVAPAA
jgi:hypothetical protein